MSALPLFDQVFSGTPAPPRRRLTGNDLKKSGMESVMRHTPDWYRDAFRSAVERFPRGKTFTVEDIRELIGDPPEGTHYNAMGPLMRMVASQGLARKTGFNVKAKRTNMHATEIALWTRI